MRAAVFTKACHPLEIQNLPDPTPGPGEVVLRIERCGICGSDLHMTEGHQPLLPFNFVAGHESSAEVVALGKGVETLKVGDHVVPVPMNGCGKCVECLAGTPFWCANAGYNMGGFAQYKLSNAASCVRLPIALSLKDAAIIEPMTCGLLGAAKAGITMGASVAILGAGPIGLAAMFWARRMGAGKIIATARTRAREGLSKKMGADIFMTMDDEFIPNVTEYLGGLPDIVIECVGVPGMIAKSIDLVRSRGTVVILGICFHADTFVPSSGIMKEVNLHFAIGTSMKQFAIVADTLAAGHVEPLAMVTDTISLDQMPATFEALRQRTTQCKVLLNPSL